MKLSLHFVQSTLRVFMSRECCESSKRRNCDRLSSQRLYEGEEINDSVAAFLTLHEGLDLAALLCLVFGQASLA